MPRIDPVTGVPVQTFFEFIGEEAKREDKEPQEIMAEIGQIFEDDAKQMKERYQQDALNILLRDYEESLKNYNETKQWYADNPEYAADHTFDDTPPPKPVEIITFMEASYKSGFREGGGGFTAKVKCADGKVRYAVFFEWSDSGSRMEPPDGGAEVNYYDEPTLTDAEKTLCERINTTHIHRDNWWKEVPDRDLRKSIEDKGLICHRYGRVCLSAVGKVALGLPYEEEDD